MSRSTWAERVLFFTQLRHLISSGLALDQSLALAAIRGSSYAAKSKRWQQRVQGGDQLHRALRDDGEAPLICALVEAGERSGRLHELCREIADFYQHCLAIKRLLIGRSIYPFILIHLALVLPALVQVILGNAGLWTIFLGPAIVWAIAATLAGALYFGQRRGWAARAALIPGMRLLTRQLVCANSALVLRAGASAGMLYHEALELAAASCGNRIWGERLNHQAQALMRGDCPCLSTALEACDFPTDMVNILHSAEAAGAVDSALAQIATVSRERFQSRVTWTAKVAVGTLLAIAMLIAVIAIFSLFTQVYLKPLNDALNY